MKSKAVAERWAHDSAAGIRASKAQNMGTYLLEKLLRGNNRREEESIPGGGKEAQSKRIAEARPDGKYRGSS